MSNKNIERNTFKKLLLAFLAFVVPISIGAVTIKLGDIVGFLYLCYFIMFATPVVFFGYLYYKYTFQVGPEKVENRFSEQAEVFLTSLEEKHSVIMEAVWDRTYNTRSKRIPRRAFDKIRFSVSEEWHTVLESKRLELIDSIAKELTHWIAVHQIPNTCERVYLEFYQGLTSIEENSPEKLVGSFDYNHRAQLTG